MLSNPFFIWEAQNTKSMNDKKPRRKRDIKDMGNEHSL